MPKPLTYEQVLSKVTKLVTEQLCLEFMPVRIDANFTTELGADSLDVVELVMAIEEDFGIEVPDEAAGRIVNIEQASKFIYEKLYE